MRYELKLPVPRTEAYRISAWLRAQPAGFRPLYPTRRVNSLYLDSAELDCFTQNTAGLTERCKVRLRWYGDVNRLADARLEIKRKRGPWGWKEHRDLVGPGLLRRTTWSALMAGLRKDLEPQWRIWLDKASEPSILVTYRRAYHQSTDGALRLTVDVDQRAYDQRLSVVPNTTRPIPIPDTVIVELKCPAHQRERLEQTASAFPLRPERCSKYVRTVASALLR